MINELTGNPGGICFQPLPVDDPKQRQPDITKARTHPWLGAEGRLREGMEQTIAWFRDRV